MADIDLSNYENGWKPKFNKIKFDELLKDTPTRFIIENKEITFREELIKTFLICCSHLNQEQDLNDLNVGDEGSGKSHLSFQLAYVKHKLLTALDMINYPFSLDLIYYNVEELNKAFDKYAHIPYMIYILDESDTLSRNKWNDPIVKKFISKLRKERKNLRLVTLNMPQLSELLPTLTLTRISLIFEVKVSTSGTSLIRGKFNLFTIPRGQSSWSAYQQKFIDKNYIKNTIAKKLYSNEDRYFTLPKSIMSFQGNFNSISPIDNEEYKKRARESNKEEDTEESPEMIESIRTISNKLKFNTISSMRLQGMTWESIGTIYNSSEHNISQWYNRTQKQSFNQET